MKTNGNWVKQSQVMFKTVEDPEYLFCSDFHRHVYHRMMAQFLDKKTNKTDFSVLYALVEFFWIVDESLFTFESLEQLLTLSSLSLSKPNLSRSLKALESDQFIERVESDGDYTYKFLTAFVELKNLT